MFPARAGIGVARKLLDVLQLLTHLINREFESNARVGHFNRRGLAAERIGLTVEFLREEIEPTPGGAPGGEYAPHFSDMRTQSVNFLFDIHAKSVESHLLTDAVSNLLRRKRAVFTERLAHSLLQALSELFAKARMDFRDFRCDIRDNCVDLIAVLEQHIGKRFAFSLATRAKTFQCLIQHSKQFFLNDVRICGVVGENARVAQNINHRECACVRQFREHCALKIFESGKSRFIDCADAVFKAALETDAAFKTAALDSRTDGLTERRLGKAQLLADFEIEVEIAGVNATHLNGDVSEGNVALSRGEPGHGMNAGHGKSDFR